MTNDKRFLEAEKEFEKAMQDGKPEDVIYWFGYRNGVKWAIEKENSQRSVEDA